MRLMSLKLKYARAIIAIATKNSAGSWKIWKADIITKIKRATKPKTNITTLTVPLILFGVAKI